QVDLGDDGAAGRLPLLDAPGCARRGARQRDEADRMRAPDQVITRRGDGTQDPYMLRWFLFRSKRDWLPRLYLHKFLRSDDDRAPHDHPWWFISIMLKGSYTEHRWVDGVEVVRRRRAPSIAYRALSTRHRVDLPVKHL